MIKHKQKCCLSGNNEDVKTESDIGKSKQFVKQLLVIENVEGKKTKSGDSFATTIILNNTNYNFNQNMCCYYVEGGLTYMSDMSQHNSQLKVIQEAIFSGSNLAEFHWDL